MGVTMANTLSHGTPSAPGATKTLLPTTSSAGSLATVWKTAALLKAVMKFQKGNVQGNTTLPIPAATASKGSTKRAYCDRMHAVANDDRHKSPSSKKARTGSAPAKHDDALRPLAAAMSKGAAGQSSTEGAPGAANGGHQMPSSSAEPSKVLSSAEGKAPVKGDSRAPTATAKASKPSSSTQRVDVFAELDLNPPTDVAQSAAGRGRNQRADVRTDEEEAEMREGTGCLDCASVSSIRHLASILTNEKFIALCADDMNLVLDDSDETDLLEQACGYVLAHRRASWFNRTAVKEAIEPWLLKSQGSLGMYRFAKDLGEMEERSLRVEGLKEKVDRMVQLLGPP